MHQELSTPETLLQPCSAALMTCPHVASVVAADSDRLPALDPQVASVARILNRPLGVCRE